MSDDDLPSLTPSRIPGMDNKRLGIWVGAAVITALVFGVQPESWWPAIGFLLLVGMVLHAVLGVPVIWIDGVDAWDKTQTVVMWAAVLAGAFGISLIVSDASTGLRVGGAVIGFLIAVFFFWLCALAKHAKGEPLPQSFKRLRRERRSGVAMVFAVGTDLLRRQGYLGPRSHIRCFWR